MNYIKITYNIFVVKNQNGFNNSLYDFINADECFYSKQDIRSMVTDFPRNYPSLVVFGKNPEVQNINVNVFDETQLQAIFEIIQTQ